MPNYTSDQIRALNATDSWHVRRLGQDEWVVVREGRCINHLPSTHFFMFSILAQLLADELNEEEQRTCGR